MEILSVLAWGIDMKCAGMQMKSAHYIVALPGQCRKSQAQQPHTASSHGSPKPIMANKIAGFFYGSVFMIMSF